jgi:hypothetical protein
MISGRRPAVIRDLLPASISTVKPRIFLCIFHVGYDRLLQTAACDRGQSMPIATIPTKEPNPIARRSSAAMTDAPICAYDLDPRTSKRALGRRYVSF